jgi:hypothetical protein
MMLWKSLQYYKEVGTYIDTKHVDITNHNKNHLNEYSTVVLLFITIHYIIL